MTDLFRTLIIAAQDAPLARQIAAGFGPGVPGGYEGPNGVCLYDPAVVNSRARVFL